MLALPFKSDHPSVPTQYVNPLHVIDWRAVDYRGAPHTEVRIAVGAGVEVINVAVLPTVFEEAWLEAVNHTNYRRPHTRPKRLRDLR